MTSTCRAFIRSTSLLLFALVALAPARASSAETPVSVSTAQHPTTPVFSSGTISIAPAPQSFSRPGKHAATTPLAQARRSPRQAQRVAEPVPFRIYSRI